VRQRVLRDGTHAGAPIPDERGDHVAAGAQPRREIDRSRSASGRRRSAAVRRHLLAVDVEAVAVVGGDVHEESRGPVGELDTRRRVKHDERVRWNTGRCDPGGRGAPEKTRAAARRLRVAARNPTDVESDPTSGSSRHVDGTVRGWRHSGSS
jgi:hypothetical protein